MIGTGYGLDNYTLGAMLAHQMLVITAIFVGIMNILLVVRHTRTDEENVEAIGLIPWAIRAMHRRSVSYERIPYPRYMLGANRYVAVTLK